MSLTLSALKIWSKISGKDKVLVRPDKISDNFSKESIYAIPLHSIEGKSFDLSIYKGKKILIVNTASECGYTAQYADLQKLYESNREKLVVVGVPSNEFGGQEPGENRNISEFCQIRYGVTFPLIEKSVVIGENRCALYKWLTTLSMNGWNVQNPEWNFSKYLINETGELICYMHSSVMPEPETL